MPTSGTFGAQARKWFENAPLNEWRSRGSGEQPSTAPAVSHHDVKSRPWSESSCPSPSSRSGSWPWPTLRTRLVRLVGQSRRRPARPAQTVHRGYAAPAARNAEASVHALIFRADSRSCWFSGARRRNGAPNMDARRRNGAPNQDARRERHRTSNQGAHRRHGEADEGTCTPTRSALRACDLPTTPWPPQLSLAWSRVVVWKRGVPKVVGADIRR